MQTLENVSINLFGQEGTLASVGANTPWEITGTDQVWSVEQGSVEIFFFDATRGRESSRRSYLLTVNAGGIVPGMISFDEKGRKCGVLAVPDSDTIVRSISLERLEEMLKDASKTQLQESVEKWIADFVLYLKTPIVPRTSVGLIEDQEIHLDPDSCAHAAKDLVWVYLQSGTIKIFNTFDLPQKEEHRPFPVAEDAWIYTQEGADLEVKGTEEIANEGTMIDGLELIHHMFLDILDEQIIEIDGEGTKQIIHRAELESEMNELALEELASVIEVEFQKVIEKEKVTNSYLAVCELVGKAQNIKIKSPPERDARIQEGRTYILNIAKASNIRTRDVTLHSGWWKEDAGPFLGFLANSNAPVALLPSKGGYVIADPVAGTRIPVTKSNEESVLANAYIFYKHFPDRSLSTKDLMKFLAKEIQPDIIRVAITAIAIGLLGMLTPIITGEIFNSAVPYGLKNNLFALTVFLGSAALTIGFIQIGQSLATLRIEGKSSAILQCALWDRLIGLPASFFRLFSAGELANKAMGFDDLRTLLTSTVVTAVMTLFSSLFSFGLLFKYDIRLALIALGLTIITVAFLAYSAFIQLKYQRQTIELDNKMQGYIFQVLTGIAKLRIADAEGRALDKWSHQFTQMKKISTKALLTNTNLSTFNSTWQVVTTILIFYFVSVLTSGPMGGGLSAGSFLAFYSAFGQFFGAMTGVAGIISTLMQAVPLYEQTKPILEAIPEVTDIKKDPGELRGDIEISHIKFRYTPELPYVLNDVSIQINSGEFAALVGPSGTGKSSLFRLLLGFERPENGTVLYDNQDLSSLDIQAVRRQIGVVIQGGKIMPGDIFTNIVGSMPYTIDDAWEAARMSGFDQDIKRMPMGMHTYISEGGGAISGGQMQRLLIARALVGRPKILLFDEATSALDNETQAIVTRSVEQLHATRIVIAHRLSTIQGADKIMVLMDGKFVQQGTFEELIKQPGEFQELAKRQIA